MSMISELVDRLRVESKSMGTYGTDYMATLLMRSADTIEMLSEKAREPKRGEWICHKGGWIDFDYYPTKYECNQCHHYVDVASDKNFCPNCGCRMKGADDE